MDNGSEPPKVVRQPTQQTQDLFSENPYPGIELTTNADRERKFEQHAHKPPLGRTQSAIAVHLKEKATGCKREFIEPARTVEEQCTAIIGNTPWPFSVCWLCGFPVGEKTENDPTMLQYIASLMGIQCVFINPLSARWDKRTCEHVNPINIAGSATLNKVKYEGFQEVLDIRMEYESAHDFCNILKNEGYFITLENGKVTMSFQNLKVAEWQIKSWPNFLLDGSMNGPALSSVICFARKNSRSDEIRKVFLKSPIHGYLFLKVLETMTDDDRDGLFNKLHPTDELQGVIISPSGNVQTPPPREPPDNSNKNASTYFKEYVTSHEPKKSKKNINPNSKSSVGSIHNIHSIALIGGFKFQAYIDSIVETWEVAIKRAMYARTKIFVNYIKKVDTLLENLLWPLMKSSTQQGLTNYMGTPRDYQELSTILQQKLTALKGNPNYDRIAVLVLTKKERNNVRAKHIKDWKIEEIPDKTRSTYRTKSPQPVPGLPVITSLKTYTQPSIFKFKALERQKAYDIGTAIGLEAVAAALYDENFMRTLKHIVDTGSLETDIDLTAAANKLITTVEEKCLTTGNNGTNNGATNGATATTAATAAATTAATTAANNWPTNVANNDGINWANNGNAKPVHEMNEINNTAEIKQQFKKQMSSHGEASKSTFNTLTNAVTKIPTNAKPILVASSSSSSSKKRGSKNITTNGGSRKLRNHRNHRTRKQKKNKKTRKNKKLTKRI